MGIGLSCAKLKLNDDSPSSSVADDIGLIVNSAARILSDLMDSLDGPKGDVVWGVCTLLETANEMAAELQGRLSKEEAK